MSKIVRELLFSADEYRGRNDKVRRLMEARGVDVLLLHSLPSICYLTGFQTVAARSYTCFLLTSDGKSTIVTERDEQYNVQQSSWVENIETYTRWMDPIRVTLETFQKLGTASKLVGLEFATRYLSFTEFSQIRDGLSPAATSDCSDFVTSCMLKKSPREVEYIREAAHITELGMRASVNAVNVDITDNEVAGTASYEMIMKGSEYMSSDPIVCVGQNSSVPHGHYRDRKIASGDTVLLEMSGCVSRYSAPLMRAVSLGAPNSTVSSMAKACRDGLESVISHVRPGVAFAEAAAAGKAELRLAGPSKIFHGTYGYSAGIGFPGVSWADCPVEIRDRSATLFEPGMVFHLPISLRDEGRYGVAMSETVLVTDTGCEVLTDMPRELFVK